MPILNVVQVISQAIVALGIPIALFTYLNSKRRERREQEYSAYHALDEKYGQYLEMCVRYPKLDMYHLPLDREVVLSHEERIQQYALCEILISLMERAYVMYRDRPTPFARCPLMPRIIGDYPWHRRCSTSKARHGEMNDASE